VPKAPFGDFIALLDESERLRGRVRQLEDLLHASDVVLPTKRRSDRAQPRTNTRGPPPAKATGRALVPMSAARRIEPVRQCDPRATAPFLSHLIATEQGAPQTRKRRRAAPNQAVAAYTAMQQIAMPM
jgi:hypothetical protein